ncbi:RNA polymerase-associated protein RTF1-like protein [Pyrus ussuriensis x Pyrus communis]|uniref:RNA polymerase-associated protein RTF1-like protein n=1 Tax=Pyrus ussuriensis x Pyrus communis TaxID=2448454 RepID=A0A5N5IB39_9ROSA|nr:RNA polymerase-associated protein RTF1-like protein [Pyrus ussuriensis x Pyrus communis]
MASRTLELNVENSNCIKTTDRLTLKKFRPKWDKGKAPQSRKEAPPLPSSGAAAKDDALNELSAKRLKQQDPEAHRKLRDASRGGSPINRSFSHLNRKSFTAVGRRSSSQSDSDSRSRSEDDGSSGDDAMIDSDDERSEGLTFDDIKEITIRRSKLAKWFMEPFFEELIVGCFVRVGIGRSKSGPISGGSSTGRHGGNCSSFGSCGWCREVD